VITLASVVEGHGEVLALPLLMRRVAQAAAPALAITAPTPFRLPRGKFHSPGELERAVAVASRRVGDTGGVMVVLDADDDCPVELADALLPRASAAAVHACPVAVTVVQREFEAWFLAALPSLGHHADVVPGLQALPDAEEVRDAKGRLQIAMPEVKYSPTRHRPAFVAAMDLQQARACRSFLKFEREVKAMLGVG